MLRQAFLTSLRRFTYRPKETSQPVTSTAEIQQIFNDLRYYKPILAESKIPTAFRIPTVISFVPLVVGAASCTLGPHFDLWLSALPDITHMTVIYAALHGALYAGVHWGLEAAVYDPAVEGTAAVHNRMQFGAATLAPCLLWTAVCSMMLYPYSHPRYLIQLAAIAMVQFGTLTVDTLYVRDYKTVPIWYRTYKIYVSISAIACIFAMAYGCYRFPEKTIGIAGKKSDKSPSELLSK